MSGMDPVLKTENGRIEPATTSTESLNWRIFHCRKKDVAEEKNDWLENHRIAGPIILVASCLSILIVILSFAEKFVELGKAVFKHDDSEIRIQVEVQNTRSNSVQIGPVCSFEVIESGGGSTLFHGGLGEQARLSPVGSFSGTNAYVLKPGEVRGYRIRLPNNQVARDLMDRGATTIKLVVVNDGRAAKGAIAFQRDVMRKEKAVVTLTQ